MKSNVLGNLGWSFGLIPLAFVVGRIAWVLSDSAHDRFFFVTFVICLPILAIVTLVGLILWKGQTPISKALLVLNALFVLYTLFPVVTPVQLVETQR